ncbi:MAG: hypothetical protein JW384_02780 [Nitrosomonadaceae bacterium]|nr:hypothetical protein [Nitrosomonadaceae bacterium]
MQLSTFKKTSNLIDVKQYYKEFGYLVIEDFLLANQVVGLRQIVNNLLEQEKSENLEYVYAPGVERVWNLVNKHQAFQDLITHDFIFELMNFIFDRDTTHQKFFLSSFQATLVRPGAKTQALHIDTPVPNPLPPWEIKANTIWLLDDFTAINGATEIISGSHLYGRRPVDSDLNDHIGVQKVIAPAGSLLVTSGFLWHRAGSNQSNEDRLALLGSFASSAFREISSEEDIIRKSLLNKEFKISNKCWQLAGGEHGIKKGIN